MIAKMNFVKSRQQVVVQIAIVLLFMAAFYSINDFYFEEITNGGQVFQTGDWLINYSAGYVRRGMAGELIYLVSNYFNLDILWTTAILQSLILSLVFYFALSLYFKSYRTQTELAILVSPAFLLFAYYDVGGAFRKELLVFLAFVVFLQFLVNKRMTLISSSLVLILYAFAAFSHELAALFLPFFLAVSYVLFKLEVITKRHFICLFAGFSLIAFSSALFALLYSGVGKSEIICNSLLIHDVPKSLCVGGSITALESNSEDAFMAVVAKMANNNYLVTYIQSFALALIPFLFIEKKNLATASWQYFFRFRSLQRCPYILLRLIGADG